MRECDDRPTDSRFMLSLLGFQLCIDALPAACRVRALPSLSFRVVLPFLPREVWWLCSLDLHHRELERSGASRQEPRGRGLCQHTCQQSTQHLTSSPGAAPGRAGGPPRRPAPPPSLALPIPAPRKPPSKEARSKHSPPIRQLPTFIPNNPHKAAVYKHPSNHNVVPHLLNLTVYS